MIESNIKNEMRNWIYIVFIFLAISCDDTLFNAGDVITKDINIEDFNRIYVEDIFEIYLLQDTVCRIRAEGGSNLLPNLTFQVDSEKQLTINDNNSARWSRNYDKIKLYISVDTLEWFELKAPSNVSCLDTLVSSYIHFISIDDYSDMDILLKSDFCYVVNSGVSGGNFTIRGKTDTFKFWARASYIINARDFIANKVIVKSESIGDCSIYSNEFISAEILRDGNVYYKGNPENIEYVNPRAREQLIKLD